jgi:pimeloyl-ACP methyl ester carboxylesterase
MSQTQTRFAEVNGARIAYDEAGAGHPLVLVHAGIADRRMWDGQVAAFAQHYRVIRYDLRGYGETPITAGTFAHRHDLIGLLETLGVARAFLIGCSMGGSTAVDVALERPDLVAALITVCSGPHGLEIDTPPPPQWDELAAAFRQRDLERVAELETQIWVDGPQRTPEQVPAAVRGLVRAMNLIALANEASEIGKPAPPLEPHAAGRLGEIRAPTLAIYGDLDQPYILQASAYLAEHIPGARSALIPGTAHLPNLERPEEFNRLVLEFLGDL